MIFDYILHYVCTGSNVIAHCTKNDRARTYSAKKCYLSPCSGPPLLLSSRNTSAGLFKILIRQQIEAPQKHLCGLSIRAIDREHSTLLWLLLLGHLFIWFSKITCQKIIKMVATYTDVPRQELFIPGLGSVVALSIHWQIAFLCAFWTSNPAGTIVLCIWYACNCCNASDYNWSFECGALLCICNVSPPWLLSPQEEGLLFTLSWYPRVCLDSSPQTCHWHLRHLRPALVSSCPPMVARKQQKTIISDNPAIRLSNPIASQDGQTWPPCCHAVPLGILPSHPRQRG